MLLTARLGRPTDQLIKQYTTPTNKCITDTKLKKRQHYNINFLSQYKLNWYQKQIQYSDSILNWTNNRIWFDHKFTKFPILWLILNFNQETNKHKCKCVKKNLLGIREVIIDLLVKDVENHIQEVPVIKYKMRVKP